MFRSLIKKALIYSGNINFNIFTSCRLYRPFVVVGSDGFQALKSQAKPKLLGLKKLGLDLAWLDLKGSEVEGGG